MKCPSCQTELASEARFCNACGQAASLTEPAQPPASGDPSASWIGREILGRYRVLAKIGEGGMGAVFRGEQLSLKRAVAIKILRPELSQAGTLARRFNAEAEVVARLSHPNTVNIYDFGQDADGTLFIAMELIEGTSLRRVLHAGGPMPAGRALAIASQIAASLADAHGHGIVHRDLKPDNVMLSERGRTTDVVRVLDFGIAKLRDKSTIHNMTMAGDLVGTPQYMAPEQITGDPLDGRADVYSLGAMLYEMLTGRLPFEAETVMGLLGKHLTETPLPPSQRRPDLGITPPLDALVMSALAKAPAQRPETMDEFASRISTTAMQLGLGALAATAPLVSGFPLPATAPFTAPAAMPTPMPPSLAGATPPRGEHLPHPATAQVPDLVGTPPAGPGAVRSRAGLSIALAVGGVVAIGAVVAIRARGDDTRHQLTGSNDPWGGGKGVAPPTGDAGPAEPPEPPPPQDDPWGKAPAGSLQGAAFRGLNFTIQVPPGFPSSPVTSAGADGQTWGYVFTAVNALITVIAVPAASAWDHLDPTPEAQARQYAGVLGQHYVGWHWRTIRGHACLAVDLEGTFPEAGGTRPFTAESVLYEPPDGVFIVSYAAPADAFEASASVRDELFEQRTSW